MIDPAEQPADPMRSPWSGHGPAGGPRRRREQRSAGEWIVYALAGLFVVYLAVTPIGYLFYMSVFPDGRFDAGGIGRAFSAPGMGAMLANTLALAIGIPVGAISIGTVLAYLYVRTNVPFKRLLFAASIVPLAIPALMYAMAWVFLLSPNIGVLNSMSRRIGGPAYDVFSLGGMILVGSLNTVPIVFLFMYAAFRAADPSLEESAAMSGATRIQIFWRVSVPLAKPALAAVLLLQIVKSLEAFEVPALLGLPGGHPVITSQIYRASSEYPIDYGVLGAQSALLVAVIGVGIALLVSRGRMGRQGETIGGKGFRPRPMDLGRWRLPAGLSVAVYFVFAVCAPVVILVYASLQPYYGTPTWDRIVNSTTENYSDVLASGSFGRALRNSLLVSVLAATIATVVGSVIAWMIVKTNLRGRRALELLVWAPLAIPSIVLGVSLLALYLRLPVGIYGTPWLLMIAYITLFLPYAFQYSSSSMYQIGSELEEAAYMSGASWLQMFRRVILPLLVPGMIASWIFIFINALREVASSILLYSPRSVVLPVELWQLYQGGRFGEAAALGVMMIAMLLCVALALRWVERRMGAYR